MNDMDLTKAQNLWKFRSESESAVRIIQNKELWFSDPGEFNDPFDCSFDVGQILLKNKNIIDPLLLSFSVTVRDISGAIDNYLTRQRKGYLCLCREWQNTLMWTHYAQDHKGCALGFEFSNDSEVGALADSSENVIYDPNYIKRAILSVSKMLSNRPTGEELKPVLKALSKAVEVVKAPCWGYEKEVRISSELRQDQEEGVAKKFNSLELSNIIFGIRCDSQFIDEVLSVLDNEYWAHVKLWKAYPDHVELKVIAKPYQ